MPIVIALANAVFAGLVLLARSLYPSAADWSYLAVGILGFHLVLELIVSQAELMDAAKISVWSVQVLSSLASVAFMLHYKLGGADWWALLVAGVTGVTTLITVIALIAFKFGGVADTRPSNRGGEIEPMG